MRDRPLTRYGLRTIALGYLVAIVALPFSVVVHKTFQNRVAPVWEALTDPAFVHALQLTVTAVAIAVPLNTVFGIVCAMALVRRQSTRGSWFFSSTIGSPPPSPVVVGLSLILV